MAIVSNKADPAVQLIRTLYFDGIIDVAVGESPACSKKPAPDMVLAALQRLGSTADEAIYLGDSEVDLQTAREFRPSPCATVGWGFRTEAELRAAGAQTDLSLAGGARQGAAERQHPVKEAGLLPFIGG